MKCSFCKAEINDKKPFYQLWYLPKTIFCKKECMWEWFEKKNREPNYDCYMKISKIKIFKPK